MKPEKRGGDYRRRVGSNARAAADHKVERYKPQVGVVVKTKVPEED